MPTQLTELYFNTLTNADPYILGSAPDLLTSYSLPVGSVNGRINLGTFMRSTTTNPAVWLYNNGYATDEIEVALRFPATADAMSSRAGVCLSDALGNGYALLFTAANPNYTITLVTITGCTAAVTPLATYLTSRAGNLDKWLKLRRQRSTGLMTVLIDDTVIGTFTDLTYDPPRGGVIAIGGSVRALRLTDISDQMVNSLNGGADIQRGKTGIPYTTSGFSSITAITTDTAGVTASGISDTTGDGTFNLSGYTEGGIYPILPADVQFTLGNGTNSANITETVTILPTESSVITSGMVTVNDNFLGYLFSQAGHSVADGGQIVWPTTANFTINADGSWSYSTGTTLVLSLWYITPDTGRSYEFDVTFTADGVVGNPPVMPDDTSVTVYTGSTTLGAFTATSGDNPKTYSIDLASQLVFTIDEITAVVDFILPAVSSTSGVVVLTATNSVGSDSQTVTYTVNTLPELSTRKTNNLCAIGIGI